MESVNFTIDDTTPEHVDEFIPLSELLLLIPNLTHNLSSLHRLWETHAARFVEQASYTQN